MLRATSTFEHDWENRLTVAAWYNGTVDHYDGLSMMVKSSRAGTTYNHISDTNGQNAGNVKLARPNVYSTDPVWTRWSGPEIAA